MRVFDASSIVYGWDNYPIQQFPALWDWVATQVKNGEISLSQVAYDEVVNVAPACAQWLRDNDVERLEVTNDVFQDAFALKNLLGIQDDDYHPNGVGENDLLIIATAKVHQVELVSDENRQTSLPNNMKKYKVPAVCNMPTVAVRCGNFVEYIKQSGQVFG